MSMIGILLCLAAATFAQNVEDPLVEFARGNAQFSADVTKVVFRGHQNKGIISPLSAQLILALTAEGAKGETYDQLKKALSLPDKARTNQGVRALVPLLNKSLKNFTLSLANKLYLGKNFKLKKEFVKVAVSDYKTEAENVNFADNQKTANVINKWVENKTNNKIQNLISSDQLDAGTRLVLVNTLYLNGKWQTPFPASATTKNAFYHLGNSIEQVDMMHSTGSYLYRHCGYLKAKFLELPFKDSNVSVTFVLPDQKNGILDLEKQPELFLELHNLTEQRVAVSLPKFSESTSHDFKDIISQLGATKVFGKDADLSGISDEGLFVSFVQQKAFINVTEAGTEAAAATAVGVQITSVAIDPKPPTLTFTADHPFFYYIRDSKSNVLLFVGRFQ